MSVKPDTWIIEQSEKNGLIEPFEKSQVKKIEANGSSKGVISFGTSSYGYDMRIGSTFQVLKSEAGVEVDPKNIHPGLYETVEVKDHLVLPPHTLALGQTVEYFRIPRDILTIAYGKSTYARVGVLVNITPFEPEWEGFATLGISNISNAPVRIYANEGIGQLIFLEASEVCAVSYGDRKGKYQAQKTITTAKI
jgi:dCTP deaminase